MKNFSRFIVSGYMTSASEMSTWLNTLLQFHGVQTIHEFWIIPEPNVKIEGMKEVWSVIAEVSYKVG